MAHLPTRHPPTNEERVSIAASLHRPSQSTSHPVSAAARPVTPPSITFLSGPRPSNNLNSSAANQTKTNNIRSYGKHQPQDSSFPRQNIATGIYDPNRTLLNNTIRTNSKQLCSSKHFLAPPPELVHISPTARYAQDPNARPPSSPPTKGLHWNDSPKKSDPSLLHDNAPKIAIRRSINPIVCPKEIDQLHVVDLVSDTEPDRSPLRAKPSSKDVSDPELTHVISRPDINSHLASCSNEKKSESQHEVSLLFIGKKFAAPHFLGKTRLRVFMDKRGQLEFQLKIGIDPFPSDISKGRLELKSIFINKSLTMLAFKSSVDPLHSLCVSKTDFDKDSMHPITSMVRCCYETHLPTNIRDIINYADSNVAVNVWRMDEFINSDDLKLIRPHLSQSNFFSHPLSHLKSLALPQSSSAMTHPISPTSFYTSPAQFSHRESVVNTFHQSQSNKKHLSQSTSPASSTHPAQNIPGTPLSLTSYSIPNTTRSLTRPTISRTRNLRSRPSEKLDTMNVVTLQDTDDEHVSPSTHTARQSARIKRQKVINAASTCIDMSIDDSPKAYIDAWLSDRGMYGTSTLFTYPFKGLSGVTMTVADAHRLEHWEFLNDVIIEFYLQFLVQECYAPRKRDVHVFNTFFYTRVAHAVETNRQSASNADNSEFDRAFRHVKNVDIFSKRIAIVPINENLHWYLAVIINPGRILKNPPDLPPLLSLNSELGSSSADSKHDLQLDDAAALKFKPVSVDQISASANGDSNPDPSTSTVYTTKHPSLSNSHANQSKSSLSTVSNHSSSFHTPSFVVDKQQVSTPIQEKVDLDPLTPQQPVDAPNPTANNSLLDMQAFEFVQNTSSDDDDDFVSTTAYYKTCTDPLTSSPYFSKDSVRKQPVCTSTKQPPESLDEYQPESVPQKAYSEAPKHDVENDLIIAILDSLPNLKSKPTLNLFQFLKRLAQDRNLETVDNPSFKRPRPPVPVQPNSCDCGIYLLHYVQRILAEPVQTIQYIGRNAGISKSIWQGEDVVNKRMELARLITEQAGLYQIECAKQANCQPGNVQVPNSDDASAVQPEMDQHSVVTPDDCIISVDQASAGVNSKSDKLIVDPPISSPCQHCTEPTTSRLAPPKNSVSNCAEIAVMGEVSPRDNDESKELEFPTTMSDLDMFPGEPDLKSSSFGKTGGTSFNTMKLANVQMKNMPFLNSFPSSPYCPPVLSPSIGFHHLDSTEQHNATPIDQVTHGQSHHLLNTHDQTLMQFSTEDESELSDVPSDSVASSDDSKHALFDIQDPKRMSTYLSDPMNTDIDSTLCYMETSTSRSVTNNNHLTTTRNTLTRTKRTRNAHVDTLVRQQPHRISSNPKVDLTLSDDNDDDLEMTVSPPVLRNLNHKSSWPSFDSDWGHKTGNRSSARLSKPKPSEIQKRLSKFGTPHHSPSEEQIESSGDERF